MSETTFICWWCSAMSDDPQEYEYPMSALGGYDAETGQPLCDGCVDAACEGAGEGDG